MKVLLLLLVSLIMVACGGGGSEAVAPTPVPAYGPILVLTPWNGGVRISSSHKDDGYTLRLVIMPEKGQETVILPEGYMIPQRVVIMGTLGTQQGKEYSVLIGPGKLPVARVVTLPLEEEVHIGPLLEGTTQVIFSAP